MDKYSLSDVHAYVVCGSSAFVTDVIPNNLNPAWLPKSRRACILPLRNAYSQLYVGVFDYDGEHEKDDFGGEKPQYYKYCKCCGYFESFQFAF